MSEGAVSAAVVEEATRRSGAVWVSLDGGSQHLVWHLWHDGAAWVVCGGLEQDLPGAGTAASAVVSVRSKASQNGLVARWEATVTRVAPGSPEWDAVVPLLHDRRLNNPDGEEQPARWARESLLLRLVPR